MFRRKKPMLKYKPLKKEGLKKILPTQKTALQKPEEKKTAIAAQAKFMKRNVNFSLFFLIIIILGSLIGLTSYYQNTYMEQSRKLQEKTQEFEVAIEELRAKKTMLNETTYQLQVEAESKEKLGGLYTDVKEEKETVKKSLEDTKQQLDSTLITLESTRDELQATKTELDEKKSQIEQYEEDIIKYKDKIDDLDGHMKSVTDNLNELTVSSACADEHQGVLDLVNTALDDVKRLKEIR